MFGDTRVVLGLLAGFCFYIYAVPAGVWFAAGINQLPFLIALAFGLHAHLAYLRTHSRLSLFATLAWTLFGLAFYEKTFLLFGLYALFALCWFSRGRLSERAVMLWRTYRLGVVAHGVVAGAYLAIYLKYGLSFGSSQPSASLISEVAYRMVGVAFSTGTIGGPLEWRSMSANSLADPSDLISLASWVVLGSLVWYAAQHPHPEPARVEPDPVHARGERLPAVVRPRQPGGPRHRPRVPLPDRVVRGVRAGPRVGLPAVARRPGGQRGPRRRATAPRAPGPVRGITTAIVLVAVVSTLAYVSNWQHSNVTKPYYDNVVATVADAPVKPAPLVDLPLPQTLLWAFGYPGEHLQPHLPQSSRTRPATRTTPSTTCSSSTTPAS